MGCDMLLALPPATDGCHALFGANVHRRAAEAVSVQFTPGKIFAVGETLHTRFVPLPQTRQTFAVLAVKATGQWGCLAGVNERRVVVSCGDWESRFKRDTPGLLGPELVRLTLERAHSAGHALTVLTELIARHGQGSFASSPEGEGEGEGDHVFLIADAAEAYAVEAAGSAWAAQEIHQVRAVGDVGVIRQDWYRLAPGLSDQAITHGWWAEDGSKLDFVGALSELPMGKASALRRWGRATLLLEQQNGHLDLDFFQRILADHYDGTHYEADPLEGRGLATPLCQHALQGSSAATAASVIIQNPHLRNAGDLVLGRLRAALPGRLLPIGHGGRGRGSAARGLFRRAGGHVEADPTTDKAPGRPRRKLVAALAKRWRSCNRDSSRTSKFSSVKRRR